MLLKSSDMSCLQCAAINTCFLCINKRNARQAIACGGITLLVHWLAAGLYSLLADLEAGVLLTCEEGHLADVWAEFAQQQEEEAKRREEEEQQKTAKSAAASAEEAPAVMSPAEARSKARERARLAVVNPPRCGAVIRSVWSLNACYPLCQLDETVCFEDSFWRRCAGT